MEVDTSDIIPPDSNNGSRGGTTKKSTPLGKRKEYMHDDTSQLSERKKKEMRIRLSLTKPSYVLGLCSKPFRSEHRRRLQYLLRRLVNQQDWVGASGVISVYLKGTIKDSSILKNRFKFWVMAYFPFAVFENSKLWIFCFRLIFWMCCAVLYLTCLLNVYLGSVMDYAVVSYNLFERFNKCWYG